MSAVAAEVSPEAQLRELYARYKQLVLATGAALVLDAPREGLERETAALLADARAAAVEPPAHGSQLRACVDAAAQLHRLLEGGGDDVAAVRETHRRLRREVWQVLPCEYVPCCASPAHAHD
jgi:hypothetical protein